MVRFLLGVIVIFILCVEGNASPPEDSERTKRGALTFFTPSPDDIPLNQQPQHLDRQHSSPIFHEIQNSWFVRNILCCGLLCSCWLNTTCGYLCAVKTKGCCGCEEDS